VIGALEAFARFGGGAPAVFVRVAGDGKSDGAAYITLTWETQADGPSRSAREGGASSKRRAWIFGGPNGSCHCHCPAATVRSSYCGRTSNWYGTATELLQELSKRVGKKVASSAGWPKSPGWLTNELRRIAPQLRINGLFVTFERIGGKRLIFVRNEAWREKYRPA
jgi:hypothetical protein